VTRNGEVVKSVTVDFDEDRSERLWIEIDGLVRDAGLAIEDLDLFAVCVGPGGFTGLRVGIAAAKGFAVAADKAMIGVTSLEATAANVDGTRPVLAMLNAYKGDVYSQLFSPDSKRGVVAANEPFVSTLRLALERVAYLEDMVLAGDATAANALEITALANEIGLGDSAQLSRCWSIESSDASPPEAVAACYVRRAEAEIKLEKGLLGSKIDRVRRQG